MSDDDRWQARLHALNRTLTPVAWVSTVLSGIGVAVSAWKMPSENEPLYEADAVASGCRIQAHYPNGSVETVKVVTNDSIAPALCEDLPQTAQAAYWSQFEQWAPILAICAAVFLVSAAIIALEPTDAANDDD